MASARVLGPNSREKPAVCINGNCQLRPVRRGACDAHYKRWVREEERRKLRQRNKELECPPNGMGVLVCAVCGRKMAEHGVTEWCAMRTRAVP